MRRVIYCVTLLAIISLSLSEARVRQRANIAPNPTDQPAIGETDFTRSRTSTDNERHVKRLQSRNQTGPNGEVIHFDFEEDKPGISAYGLPRKHLQNNGVIERLHVREDRISDAPKSARLVEVYGMPKDKIATNGLIERLPLAAAAANRQAARLGSHEENFDVRARRSVREGPENKVGEKVASEAEDMQAQDTMVFRPLFVYRQQIANRQSRKRSRNLTHRYHRHASHHYCGH